MSKQIWGGVWQNEGEIDAGGQSNVFKVQHIDTHRVGALKRLKNPKRLDRFQNEVQAIRKLEHPNIIPLIDANLKEEPFYAVYEYESGGSLADLSVKELCAIPLSQRLGWCEDICDALQEAHHHSCIHRDVKPDNILLSPDHTKARLCDFGLVYFNDDGERVTATMEQVGSRYYIPPESEDGRADMVSSQSDLYSMGKVLYYVTSGGRIFAREKQREPGYDLAKSSDDPYLEVISRIVDSVVTDDPGKRLKTALELKNQIYAARDCIIRRLPCPGVEKTYRCMFCGVGFYKQICLSGGVHSGDAINNGYKEGNIGQEYMVFLECTVCGNCQRFKLKYGGEKWFPEAHRNWQAIR